MYLQRWSDGSKENSFDNWLNENKNNEEKNIFRSLDFLETIRQYEKVFGKENVTVLLFEEFVQNKRAFIDKLASFMGVDSEEAFSLAQ